MILTQGPARLAGPILILLVLCLAAIGSAVAAEPRFPPLSGRVVDQANILSASTRARLSEILDAHEKKTSNQVVVVTLSSLQGYDIADFGVRLGRAWKLGQADRNNGAVLIVAPNERAVRIEVGYGLEGDLTDARSHAIIQNEILPRFRAGDIEGGVVQGTLAILGTIEGTYTAKPPPAAAPEWIGSILIPLLMFGIFAWIMMMQRRYSRSANSYSMLPPMIGGIGSGMGGGFGRPMGGFGGSSGGFGSGGRPFGGGGGSFGGGGASGRW